jgi:hypothetical protein
LNVFSPRIHEATMTSLLRIVKKHSAFCDMWIGFPRSQIVQNLKMGTLLLPRKSLATGTNLIGGTQVKELRVCMSCRIMKQKAMKSRVHMEIW